jgi:hypothetical protein
MRKGTPFWERVYTVASKIGATDMNIQKWKQRGFVPAKWQLPLFLSAPKHGVTLTLEELTKKH